SALTLVAWLSAAGGGLLDRAEAGLDGGIIGWGLTEILGIIGLSMPERTILLGVLFVFFAAIGLGLFESVTRWAEKYAGNETEVQSGGLPFPSAVEPRAVPSAPTSGERLSPAEPSVPVPAKRAKPAALPAEFRKSFRLPAEEKDVDIAIPQRSERLPPLNLLIGEQNNRPDERHINLTAGLIEKTLAEFGIPGKVVGFRVGPTVTQFALEPGFLEKPGPDGALVRQKIRVSQISALSRDLALALSVERLRIEAPVPGRSFVGIEVPNTRSSVVRLRPILESDVFYKTGSALAVALGRDVSGRPLVADLSRMPHLLIAGTTGSGKSVCIEALTACMVMNNTPEDLRLVMIDPKMVELVRFNGLPHLYGKVETELERILAVLRWAIAEMDHRYRLLENVHARDIEAYNRKMEKRKQPGLPRIVLIIDELADLMMSSPDQTEHSLVRLAQLARATGIHLVIATQRPSTDVVTGLIKANFPARIAFTVASSVDSRVILDTTGAETLLGRGDMLFLSPEAGSPVRSQGVMITDQEVERIITFWQKMSPQEAAGKAAPWEEMMSQEENSPDALIQQAIEIVRGTQRASASLLQRRLRVGYPRAARLIDELEDLGVIGPSQGGGKEREVLIDRESEDEIE
ncbi:MAG: DNA translocase FtsK, partial [Chloroflexi bacterium]|nr:DNA translocase FtsK [Chloroflexota bacterium]